MVWSVSDSRTFRRCQLQWYYQRCVGSHAAKDPVRRKAYRLGKLQSISMWRGSLVDTVLSEVLVPSLNRGTTVTKGELLRNAFQRFDRELAYARTHDVLDPSISPSHDKYFAALDCLHHDGACKDSDLLAARKEIDQAIRNLFDLPELPALLKPATIIFAQRPLSFRHSGVCVRAVPDIIAFYSDQPPAILDWKVHAFGFREAWLQLGIYAIALARCNRHADFPDDLKEWTESEIRLVEVQLLTSKIRTYSLSEEDMIRLENYISQSAADMLSLTGGKKFRDLNPEDFLATRYPDNCGRCKFKSLCWQERDDRT